MSVGSLMEAKEAFDEVYEEPDAAPYYRAYAPTRLSVVEYPAALVRTLVELGVARGPVVDLGCGYGTLGLLLRAPLAIDGVYAAYLGDGAAPPLSDAMLLPRIVGIDRSELALAAARRDGGIDEGHLADLNDAGALPGNLGPEAIAVCTAVLGYVHPSHLRRALEVMRIRLAVVTCVTWLLPEMRRAFAGGRLAVTRLSEVPVFQRWATVGERRRMPRALVAGAHRAQCLALHVDPVPADALRARVETLRIERSRNRWLAAGRPGGCELVASGHPEEIPSAPRAR